MVAVAQTPGEAAGSFLRVGSEIGHRMRHARCIRPEVVTPSCSGGHFSDRAAACPRRLCATATTMSRSPARLLADARSNVGDSLGDGTPSDCHGPAARDGHPAAASDAVCCEVAAVGAIARRGSLCGAKGVGLTVSGLKSDSPPTIGIAGSARAGVRAQERAVCRNSRPTAAAGEHSTFCRPTEALRFGRTRIGLQTERFLGTADDRPAASPESVRPDADAQADCARKKGLQIQAFFEAAEGIRTLDLLHGKQYILRHLRSRNACKSAFPSAWTARSRSRNYAEIPGV